MFMSDAPHAGPKAPGAMLREIIPQLILAHGRVKVGHGSNKPSAYETRQSEVDYRAALVENHKEEDSSAQHVEVEDLLKLEQELLRTTFPHECFVAPELNPDQYPSTPPPGSPPGHMCRRLVCTALSHSAPSPTPSGCAAFSPPLALEFPLRPTGIAMD